MGVWHLSEGRKTPDPLVLDTLSALLPETDLSWNQAPRLRISKAAYIVQSKLLSEQAFITTFLTFSSEYEFMLECWEGETLACADT